MVVIGNAASRFNNNHMVWDYAHWLLNFLEQDGILENTLENIWIRNTSYISKHITDFSALSFRQKLIKKLIHFENRLTATFKYDTIHSCQEYSRDLPNNLTSLFEFALIVGEMKSNESLISFYINHESLWHYRRFLCHVFVRILPQRIAQKKQLPDFKSTYSVSYKSYENMLFMLNQSFLTNAINNEERYFHNHQKWMSDFGIIDNHES